MKLTVTSYDEARNIRHATTDDGRSVEFDPFAGRAIAMTDEGYDNGAECIGKTYDVTKYTTCSGPLFHGGMLIVPHEDGMKLVAEQSKEK